MKRVFSAGIIICLVLVAGAVGIESRVANQKPY